MSQLLLLLLLASIISAEPFQTALCAPGRLEIGGVELVERNRGRILLTIRTGINCHDCHKHFREFSLMAESISDLSVAILIPQAESPSAVRHSQLEFPRLQITHDSQGRTSHWPEGQQILFDRCGRVSKIIFVASGAPPFHDALEAIRLAVSHAQCGWCQYDTRGARDLSRKQFDAYIRSDKRNSAELRDPRQLQHSSPQYQPPRHDYPSHQRQQSGGYVNQQHQRQQEYRYPHDQQGRSYSHYQQPQPNYQQAQIEQRRDQLGQQQYHSSQNSQQQYQQNFGSQSSSYQQGMSRSWEGSQPNQDRQGEQRNYWQETNSKLPTTSTQKPMKKLHYSEDSDYGDYLDEQVATTQKTETQIPAPRAANPWWPTQISMTTIDYRLLMGADVPCAAFTDDICFAQQEKMGRTGQMPKCCSKGIYLTDLCIPGKCSNSTTQLCCLQKFLQAKYACCGDESQSDSASTTNKFSQCCYSKFVTKDDCCDIERADDYWSSVHELCLPNTKVDLSTVKLEVRFAEGMRVIDLGENRVWDHECKHGGNRVQLSYFP